MGVEQTVERLNGEGRETPALAQTVLDSSCKTFYGYESGRATYFCLESKKRTPIPTPSNVILLSEFKDGGKTIVSSDRASLLDLGDGIACLELHSKMNTLHPDSMDFFNQAIDKAEGEFIGLLIATQGPHFSAGADLKALGERRLAVSMRPSRIFKARSAD